MIYPPLVCILIDIRRGETNNNIMVVPRKTEVCCGQLYQQPTWLISVLKTVPKYVVMFFFN